jgi:Cu/Ag efflux protein CusF
MTRIIIAAALISMAFPLTALAVEAHHQGTTAVSPAAGQLADGEVRRVDKDAKKLTIRHGPIESLGMPPMTMVFQVKDPAMLDKVKAGDKIKFAADKVGGAYTVNQIEVVK